MRHLDALKTIPPNALIYISGPYEEQDLKDPTRVVVSPTRIELAITCMQAMMLADLKPISTLLMTMSSDEFGFIPSSWDYWRSYSKLMLSKCDYVVILAIDGWKHSSSVAEDVAFAQERGIEILYASPNDLIDSAKQLCFEQNTPEGTKNMELPKVVGIQIVPVIDDGELVVAQPEGPTEATTNWSAYLRMEDGSACWKEDMPDEEAAAIASLRLASEYRVEVEPQAWVK